MAKVIARPPAADLYVDDLPLWPEHRAALPALYAGLGRPVGRQLVKDSVPPDALCVAWPYTLDPILDLDWYPDGGAKALRGAM